jgi:hypothetical protein
VSNGVAGLAAGRSIFGSGEIAANRSLIVC